VNPFVNKKILITGGTGSFGKEMINYLIKKRFGQIIIYSRDEMKQWLLKESLNNRKDIKFIIGDVRDESRITDSFRGIDYVIHAAATKIVPTAEKNPEECIKTNILGALNVIKASIENKVKKVIALSTDKASSPINLYGATKLCSDKLFISKYYENLQTKFSVVRYGNVLGSRGSILPFFLSIKEKNIFPLTHQDMTRFFLSLEEAVSFVSFCLNEMKGGEIFIKKLPSILIKDLIKVINPKPKIKIIGLREGEKIHEQMIGIDDALYTAEFKNHFEILPDFKLKSKKIRLFKGKPVNKDFFYSSNNTKKINLEYLKDEILKIDKKLQSESSF
jgi:UDP-N-acetylglucosamine 4,6-dehydratase (inverting)